MLRHILVVDNHDSFVHTLIGYLRELGAEVTMVEADAIKVHADGALSYPGGSLSLSGGSVSLSGGSVSLPGGSLSLPGGSLSLSKGPTLGVGDASTSSATQVVGSATQKVGSATEVVGGSPTQEGGSATQADFDAVMISPGPGTPRDAGASIDMVRWAAQTGIPLLGVCLGHQAIGAAFGMPVVAAPELMHGMVSQVRHDDSALFAGIPSPFAVGRYHSLALDEADLPPSLRVTARTDAGTVMAIAHASLPILGVQFHPESILTEHGHRLLGNWLEAYSPVQ